MHLCRYDLHVLLVGHGKKCVRCSPDGHPRKPVEGPCPLQYPIRTKQAKGGSDSGGPDEEDVGDAADDFLEEPAPSKRHKKSGKAGSSQAGKAKGAEASKGGQAATRKTPQRAAKRGKANVAPLAAGDIEQEGADAAASLADGDSTASVKAEGPDAKVEVKQEGVAGSPSTQSGKAAERQSRQGGRVKQEEGA